MGSEDDMHDCNDLEEFYSSSDNDVENDSDDDYVYDNDSDDDASPKLVSIRQQVPLFISIASLLYFYYTWMCLCYVSVELVLITRSESLMWSLTIDI